MNGTAGGDGAATASGERGRISASADEETRRLQGRKWILRYARRRSVGAELGVFCGDFSRILLEELRPARLYLVDAWSLMWGERYPDWGSYTDHGRLTTAEAKARTASVKAEFPQTEIEIREMAIEPFLQQIDRLSLDFIYLDAGHGYEETLQQLLYCATRVKHNGVILGDDWKPDPKAQHHGVYRAIQDFTRMENFEIVAAGPAAQFCLRRRLRRPL